MAFKIGDKLTRSGATARHSFAVGATTAASSEMEPGLYLVTASTACFVTQGASDVVSSVTAASAFLPAGGFMYVAVDGEDSAFFAAIRASADGRLFLQKIATANG